MRDSIESLVKYQIELLYTVVTLYKSYEFQRKLSIRINKFLLLLNFSIVK